MSTPTLAGEGLRSKVKEIDEDLGSLRDERAQAAAALKAATVAFAAVDGYDPESPEYKSAQDAREAVEEIEGRIAKAQTAQMGVLKMLGQSDPSAGERGKNEGGAGSGDPEASGAWSAKAMLADPELRSTLERHSSASKSHLGEVNLGQLISRDALKADVSATTQQRLGPYYGVVPQLQRPLRVLDLIPTGTMDGLSFYYTQETGTFLAAGQVEGQTKQESDITYTDVIATAETIAAYQKVRKQVLSDTSALQSILESRLRYSVLRKLEAEVLAGNGSSPNIQGIIGEAGVQTVTHGVDLTDTAPGMDLILTGMTKIILADSYPDAIVMHPTDWSEALRSKTTGSGEYFSNGPFSVTAQSMWGLPLIPSPAIPLGEALVGDFSMGAQLFIREGVNVIMSDNDGSDFTQNRVTILAEMRAALAIWRPSLFCLVNLKEIS